MRAIQFDQVGGPEVLKVVEASSPPVPDSGLLVDVRAAGVNFLDIYFRRGTYPVKLPFIPGDEGVGIVREVGSAATDFKPGDRVAWTAGGASYAEVAVAPAKTSVKLPDSLPDDAGFIIAQGLTAHYLAHDVLPLDAGSVALVHAAAGGVGSLLTRMLKRRGVRVIATVSSEAKMAAARTSGADEVLVVGRDEFTRDVRALTGGRGVTVAYDGVGRDTFEASMASIASRGTMVLYGASSGPVPLIDPMMLAKAGSISFIRPRLMDYIAGRDVFQARIDDLFTWLLDGQLQVNIGARYPLERAADAHRALESRTSVGKLILTMDRASAAGSKVNP